jgi:hypothetical protein
MQLNKADEAVRDLINATADLPRFQSIKQVRASQIKAVTILADGGANLYLADPVIMQVTAEYMEKHKPEAGGFFVLYDGGYQSYSSAKPFKTGYVKIPDFAPQLPRIMLVLLVVLCCALAATLLLPEHTAVSAGAIRECPLPAPSFSQ